MQTVKGKKAAEKVLSSKSSKTSAPLDMTQVNSAIQDNTNALNPNKNINLTENPTIIPERTIVSKSIPYGQGMQKSLLPEYIPGKVRLTKAQKPTKNPYTEVDASSANSFRDLLPVPDNAAQMLAKVVYKDARMNNESLDDDQKLLL